jgi:GNAT superfamily N-acetyltransferase
MITKIQSFLPETLWIARGTPADYRSLERFHYRAKSPATWAGVWVVRYGKPDTEAIPAAPMARDRHPELAKDLAGSRSQSPSTKILQSSKLPQDDAGELARDASRVVAVGVLSYPTVNSGARDRALGLSGWEKGRRLGFVNEHVRTISRVVVHPQFRSLGLASRLVGCICSQCPTRYVEAYAVMGRVHPFFEKGGMERRGEDGGGRMEDGGEGRPVYYFLDRGGGEIRRQKAEGRS